MIGLLVAASRFVSILPSTPSETKRSIATQPKTRWGRPFRTG